MPDTPPEVAEMVRSRIMSLSGAERLIMGAQMFEATRQMGLASLRINLPPEELKRHLFEQIYGVAEPFRCDV